MLIKLEKEVRNLKRIEEKMKISMECYEMRIADMKLREEELEKSIESYKQEQLNGFNKNVSIFSKVKKATF